MIQEHNTHPPQYNDPMTFESPTTANNNDITNSVNETANDNNNNNTESEHNAPEEEKTPEEDHPIKRTLSQSSNPSIDSAQKITARGTESWSTDMTNDVLNFEQYKEKYAQAKHWKACKLDLKKYVARVKNEAAARKFEIEIKVIGRR